MRPALIGLLSCIGLGFASPAAASSAERLAQTVWTGSEPCTAAVFHAPALSPQGHAVKVKGGDGIYTLPDVGRFTFKAMAFERPPLYGMKAVDAFRDLVKRDMIVDPYSRTGRGATRLGQIHLPWNRTMRVQSDGGEYRIRPSSLNVVLTPTVTLPEWTNYVTARPADKAVWDRAACSTIHREMGHALVAMQILMEEAPSYLELSSSTRAGLDRQITRNDRRIATLIAGRQDAFHRFIAATGPRGKMHTPYFEFGLPWVRGWAGRIGG